MHAATELEVDRLRQQVERLQRQLQVLDNVKDACAVLDRDYRFVFVNRSGEALCRRKRDELLGRAIVEVFPFLAGTPILESVSMAVERCESVRFEQFYPQAEVWLEGEAHPSPDGGASVFVRDIAERKRVVEELHERDQELERITDHLPVIISHVDSDVRICRLNKAYEVFLGRKASEAIGKHLREAAGDVHFNIAQPYVERALRGERVSFESRLQHRDGSFREIQAIYTPKRKPDGSLDGFVSVILDISSRKRFEREREQLLQELSTERRRLGAIFESFPAGSTGRWNRFWENR
jgi:PAS domain S-box-containing protein